MPTAVLSAHAAATWTMVGLIWVVQLVHYPLFHGVGAAAFPAFHRAHMRRMTWIVAPVVAVEGLTAAWIAWAPPSPDTGPLALLGAALFVLVLAATAFVSVPCHRSLEGGYDAQVVRRLVSTNWVRTVLWTARGGIALWLLASV